MANQELEKIDARNMEFQLANKKLQVPDGYPKGKGNERCNIGNGSEYALDQAAAGFSPAGTATGIPQNVAGTYERIGADDFPRIVRSSPTSGANSHDVSSNGTETDIYSRQNCGVDFTNNSRGNLEIPHPMLNMAHGDDGSTNWTGVQSIPFPGQEYNMHTVNGKPQLGTTKNHNIDQVYPHLPIGATCLTGGSDNYISAGQNAVIDISVQAQKDEVDSMVDYVSAADNSGSAANEVELKQNQHPGGDNARVTIDAQNGKITLTITGGENQYTSTIVMTSDDITCVTHTFNVIAEESINMLAGEQKSSVIMNKDSITITNNETSSVTLTKPMISVQSKMIMENAQTLLKMDAAMIMENCASKKNTPTNPTNPTAITTTVAAKANEITSTVTNNISGNLSSFTNPSSMLSNLGGLSNLGSNLSGALSNLNLNGLTDKLGSISNLNIPNNLNLDITKIGNFGCFSLPGVSSLNLDPTSIIKNASNLNISNLKLSNPLQSISNEASSMMGQVTNTISQGTNFIQQGISNLTAGMDQVSSTINSTLSNVTGSINNMGRMVKNIVGGDLISKATSVLGNLSTGMIKIPENLGNPMVVLHVSDPEIKASDYSSLEDKINNNVLIIYNIIYKNNELTESEKENYYNYLSELYKFLIYIDTFCTKILNEFPIYVLKINLYFIFLHDLQNYIQKIKQIINDFIQETRTVTVKQIINDIEIFRIQGLQAKDNIKAANPNVQIETTQILDDYIDEYTNLLYDLIKLINELSGIKIDLTELIIEASS